MRVFVEQQKFDMLWMRLLMGIILLGSVIPIISTLSESSREQPAQVFTLVTTICIVVALTVFMLFVVHLKTRIDEQGVGYGFYPFRRKLRQTPWSEIQNIQVREYSAISEFGGWGFKISWFGRKGVSYTIRGKHGIQLELNSGKRILIGTQKQSEAEAVIHYYTTSREVD